MAIDNVRQVEFSDAEIKVLNDAILAIEEVLKNKTVQLNADDSRHYGKLGKATEGWAVQVFQDATNNPILVPQHIDAEVWTKNEKAHAILSPLSKRLESITLQMKDTNRVIGYNIVLACTAVYRNAKELCLQNVVGYKVYFDKWKVQFANRGRKKAAVTTVKEG
jgi:hypothetical protein